MTRLARPLWPVRPSSLLRHGASLPRAWHLLSLDAPTVAVTWCIAFLRAAGVVTSSRATYFPALFLGLATWLCYVGDRVLDARSAPAFSLRARHRFYGLAWRSQRALLLTLVCSAGLACALIALVWLSHALLASYAALTLASLLYFAWVHCGVAPSGLRLPKEALVAVIFACGCLMPAWQTGNAASFLSLAPRGALFAMLCWLNCVAIERWEAQGELDARAHESTRWAARHLTLLSCAGAVAALLLRALLHPMGPTQILGPCLATAFALLAIFDRLRARLSAEALRILADVALLTPLAWWLLAGVVR